VEQRGDAFDIPGLEEPAATGSGARIDKALAARQKRRYMEIDSGKRPEVSRRRRDYLHDGDHNMARPSTRERSRFFASRMSCGARRREQHAEAVPVEAELVAIS